MNHTSTIVGGSWTVAGIPATLERPPWLNRTWLIRSRLLPLAFKRLPRVTRRGPAWVVEARRELYPWWRLIQDAHGIFTREIAGLREVGVGTTPSLVVAKGARFLQEPRIRSRMFTRDIDLLLLVPGEYAMLCHRLIARGYAQFSQIRGDGIAQLASMSHVAADERRHGYEYYPWVRYARLGDDHKWMTSSELIGRDGLMPFRVIRGIPCLEVGLDIHYGTGCPIQIGELVITRRRRDSRCVWNIADADHLVLVGVRCEAELRGGIASALGALVNAGGLFERNSGRLFAKCARAALRLGVRSEWERFAIIMRSLTGTTPVHPCLRDIKVAVDGECYSLQDVLFSA